MDRPQQVGMPRFRFCEGDERCTLRADIGAHFHMLNAKGRLGTAVVADDGPMQIMIDEEAGVNRDVNDWVILVIVLLIIAPLLGMWLGLAVDLFFWVIR